MSHLFKRFSRDITGLIWLSIGIFLAISLYSYHPTDPSLNAIGRSLKVENFCGYFGSFLSDILYQIFGLSAWFIVLGNLRLAFKNFCGIDIKLSQIHWTRTAILLVTCSALLALYFPNLKLFTEQIYLGGLLGNMGAKALIGVLNKIGAAVLLWTAMIVFIVFYTEKSIGELTQGPRRFFLGFWQRLPSFKKLLAALTGLPGKWVAKAPQNLAPAIEAENTADLRAPRFFLLKSEEASGDGSRSEDGPKTTKENRIDKESSIDIEPERRPIHLRKKVQRRIENWELPKISLLEDPPYNRKKVDDREIRDKAQRLLNKLQHFGISGDVTGAKPGPAVTMFEFKPSADVKISRITELADDLSLELSSESVRIIAPIPGRDVVGIETSNSIRDTVYLKEILASDEFWDEKIALPLALGCQADGMQKVVDLRKMPHLLVAGTTGSGKSVFVVSLLTGLLFRHSPKTLRLILIDPKQVDLAVFSKIPHLLMPPIREPKKAINALRWAIKEMEKRYRSMAKFAVRDLEAFNETVAALPSAKIAEYEAENNEIEGINAEAQTYYYSPQPYTIIVVEEFGDLMAVDKSNVESCVVRLAQMARACGLHLILAMQSPRKDVVTGLIKTNIPGRVSFKVSSKMDSRIILDEGGAERLLSRGDMLFLAPGVSKPLRHHGPWVSDAEIQSSCKFWTEQAAPDFDPKAIQALESNGGGDAFDASGLGGDSDDFDERYDEVLAYISTLKEVSASHIQMRFRLGYPRAARLMEVFEQQGVVGIQSSGSKKRPVLINELK